MTDIETLGKQHNPTIIQIASCAFDIYTGEILYKFNESVNIKFENKLSVDGDTLSWWLNTDKELLTKIINEGTCNSEMEMLIKFHQWITDFDKQNVFLWGNGILFDNRIIKSKMEQYDLKYPIFYRNDRDMRTIIELASIKSGYKTEKEFKDNNKLDGLIAHDAYDDVIYQIYVLNKAWNILI